MIRINEMNTYKRWLTSAIGVGYEGSVGQAVHLNLFCWIAFIEVILLGATVLWTITFDNNLEASKLGAWSIRYAGNAMSFVVLWSVNAFALFCKFSNRIDWFDSSSGVVCSWFDSIVLEVFNVHRDKCFPKSN